MEAEEKKKMDDDDIVCAFGCLYDDACMHMTVYIIILLADSV